MARYMIGVVVPAHNEEAVIVACVEHIRRAAHNARLKDEMVEVVVVADACADDTEAYQRAGGFRALACNEDVELVRSLEAMGARIAWSARPRVTTSARRIARAAGGFADTLADVVAQRLLYGAAGPGSPKLAS